MEKKNLETTYSPKDFEKRIYENWLNKGYFTPKVDKDKKPYTIVMPPPNITGKLHMGHALDLTLQDMLIRFKRMQGYEALWLPGEDHASIATEVRVENELLKQGLVKKEMGREAFLEKVYEWSEEYREKIRDQIKKMGSSCDFTREAFTMDENLSRAVREVFVKLYHDGLIYRGNRITNWCPKCETALSDAEIEYVEHNGNFWHFRYPLSDGSGYLVIATTRPETMLGDTAVAVHPEDERFRHLVGKTLDLPLMDRVIPIVADDYVDREFGTGCVKITPAHDPNDFHVGERHHLEAIRVLDDKGIINEFGGKYQGMDRYEARKAIVSDMEKLGLLEKIEPHTHNVNTHDRCGTVIEPIISRQWYVEMKPLAGPAIDAVRSGKTNFVPERFEKTYFHWLENIQDWCISRQLWWGHRIPVWYCDDCQEVIVSNDTPHSCTKCGSTNLREEEDVLDTWFSSALWPFSTLGWPNETEDLKYFYPTSTLVTGYDIIPFWVMRMMFSGLYNMGEIPFDTVFIHGIVRDAQGRKMSKSLGNGVDPLETIDIYGADALRFMLITGNAPGSDIRFYPERVEASRNFANKLWNASRFVLMNIDDQVIEEYKDSRNFSLADRWILSKLNNLIEEVTENFEKFELGIALAKVYDFIWNELCDWYIELIKPVFYNGTDEEKGISYRVIREVLIKSLKLLHPTMPFITEEIYTFLNDEETIMTASWPVAEKENIDAKIEDTMSGVIEAIKSIRNLRQEMNVPNKRKSTLYILPNEGKEEAFVSSEDYLIKLAYAEDVVILKEDNTDENNVSLVTSTARIYIPLLDLIDRDKELERLGKEKTKLESEIERVNKKLGNEKFLANAKEEVIQEEKAKAAKYQAMLDAVDERIQTLK
ncbi:valine--tRNA ligase [Proteiniclasticum sp.]|uniref:valine--tRNA ligase n=1 Tax=Proteiniclasticum sp. TaxID=2053595 RepID=UPI00289B9B89|nr:valine--tRNA ligase [Proteiniclasticum sp.]